MYKDWKYYEPTIDELCTTYAVGVDPGDMYSFSLWGVYEDELLLVGYDTERIVQSGPFSHRTYSAGKHFQVLLERDDIDLVFVEDQFEGPLTNNHKLKVLKSHAGPLIGAVVKMGKSQGARIEPRVWRNTIDWQLGDPEVLKKVPYIHQADWKTLAIANATPHIFNPDIAPDDNEAEAILIGKSAMQMVATQALNIIHGPFSPYSIPYVKRDRVMKITKETIREYQEWKSGAGQIPY